MLFACLPATHLSLSSLPTSVLYQTPLIPMMAAIQTQTRKVKSFALQALSLWYTWLTVSRTSFVRETGWAALAGLSTEARARALLCRRDGAGGLPTSGQAGGAGPHGARADPQCGSGTRQAALPAHRVLCAVAVGLRSVWSKRGCQPGRWVTLAYWPYTKHSRNTYIICTALVECTAANSESCYLAVGSLAIATP